MAGCETGFSACYLAREIDCEIVGIDNSEPSIEKAKERAKRQKVSDKAKFRVGNAHALPFEAETFDAVITEFVSQFLDRERAFKEFARILRPRAYVGINEMYRKKEIPAKAAKEIDQAEKIIGEIIGLPFSLLPPEKWKEELQRAGLKDVNVRMYKHIRYLQETKYMAEAMGGTWSLWYLKDTILKMTKYYLLSKKIRYRFKRLEESKKSSSEKNRPQNIWVMY